MVERHTYKPVQAASFESTNSEYPDGLIRHDSMFSVSSDTYTDPSQNNLGMVQGAILLMADCIGTGLLALPHDIAVLGKPVGIVFLILNLPINQYAGTILSYAAQHVEDTQAKEDDEYRSSQSLGRDDRRHKTYSSIANSENPLSTASDKTSDGDRVMQGSDQSRHTHLHHDTATFDFIGMTSVLFSNVEATRWILILFYTNVFLVLGNYVLVMSHSVAALLGEDWICVPEAGMVASTLMFALTQMKTMAQLGRGASIISLVSLTVVVAQCLIAANVFPGESKGAEQYTLLRKMSALGSIGFAVGSQKLLLNIRHELKDRTVAPQSLAVALTSFGTVYVTMSLTAGDNPPAFLFDAIPAGTGRRIAGLLLWIHVAVSYAINSQAICASMDRLFLCRVGVGGLDHKPTLRWTLLTGTMAVSAFLVANAIPFFKDLVALIGALTSVPLTLLLPAIFFRKYKGFPLWTPTRGSKYSYALIVFSVVFISVALVGAIGSIYKNWEDHGGPFSCH